ncbi:hypothetical protein [Streptomyces sp. JJ38]|uniref:hypothetical protein n=1 Tax=Streptomyces sp. JJ38 TaxID=2738128 RepID=UPI001C581B52|nr:hypothetical protein [Streptomyces sp. JJ38]MBW1596010.1 hypothetical protein [Streptomyces sp. JJ38]
MSFHTSLRFAIAAQAMSLQELVDELRARGVRISVSTLSAWQTGRSRPEGVRSLEALPFLEELLGLDRGTLRAGLPARRPRGRRPAWEAALATRHATLWRSSDAVRRLLAKVDADWSALASPQPLSQRSQCWVNRDGREAAARTSRLLRAGPGGAERFVSVYRFAALSQAPRITTVGGCTPARFRADPESGLAVFEFLLDRPLREGESAVVDVGLLCPSGRGESHFTCRVHSGARMVCLEAVFDSGRIPDGCFAYYQEHSGGRPRVLRRVSDAERGARFQHVEVDPVPGIYGVRWG